jgi:hypothetical protein
MLPQRDLIGREIADALDLTAPLASDRPVSPVRTPHT